MSVFELPSEDEPSDESDSDESDSDLQQPEPQPQPEGNIDVQIRAAQRLVNLKEVQQKIAALEHFLVVEQERDKLGPPDGPFAEAAFDRWEDIQNELIGLYSEEQ
eukprot:SAG11_NODE_28984_length_315_cov_1.782407_1_plen_104_part_11